jgi:hypothetical protein
MKLHYKQTREVNMRGCGLSDRRVPTNSVDAKAFLDEIDMSPVIIQLELDAAERVWREEAKKNSVGEGEKKVYKPLS